MATSEATNTSSRSDRNQTEDEVLAICSISPDTMNRVIENTLVTTLATITVLTIIFSLGKSLIIKLLSEAKKRRPAYDRTHSVV